MTSPISKIITIVDPQTGLLKETIIEHDKGKQAGNDLALIQGARRGPYGGSSLREAATTSEFPTLLRDGLKQILFSAYNEEPSTYQEIVFAEPSNKPAEDWLEMNSLGTLPVVAEGNPYPEVKPATDRVARVANYKRGYIFNITEEMIRFDRANQMRQYPQDMGTAAKQTIETDVYSVLSTAGNYTRNSTTGDNDVGANTAATTFSASGLITAFAVIRTMKDRKSGRYMNIIPDTLLVTPQLEFAAKQLLMSPSLQVPGTGVNAAVLVYGTGGENPFRGLVTRIIVSPFLGTSYQWVLMKAKRAVVYQEVDPLQLLVDDVRSVQNEGYFLYDNIRYRVRIWYGTGMVNDRFAYYSSSTTAPTLA